MGKEGVAFPKIRRAITHNKFVFSIHNWVIRHIGFNHLEAETNGTLRSRTIDIPSITNLKTAMLCPIYLTKFVVTAFQIKIFFIIWYKPDPIPSIGLLLIYFCSSFYLQIP